MIFCDLGCLNLLFVWRRDGCVVCCVVVLVGAFRGYLFLDVVVFITLCWLMLVAFWVCGVLRFSLLIVVVGYGLVD